MNALLRDLANARRGMVRAPGFSASAVIMLAIGIAMWTLMFSVLNGLILRPLPVRDQQRLILAWRADRLAGLRGQGFREALLTRFAGATRTFSGVASMFAGGVRCRDFGRRPGRLSRIRSVSATFSRRSEPTPSGSHADARG